jgi:hypothetical protein
MCGLMLLSVLCAYLAFRAAEAFVIPLHLGSEIWCVVPTITVITFVATFRTSRRT